MSDDDVSMIEPDTRMRVFARYLWVCRGWKRSVAITTGGAAAGVYPVNERSCVRACESYTHAEDDPAVESRAAVLCGNARRHLGLSILLPTLRPRPPQPPRLSTVVRSPSLPPREILFLFCSSFSPCPLDPACAPLSSAFVPLGFLSSRKLACARVSIVNVFCRIIFVKFLSENWEFYACVQYPTMGISFEREKAQPLFFILKMYEVVPSLLEGIAYVTF